MTRQKDRSCEDGWLARDTARSLFSLARSKARIVNNAEVVPEPPQLFVLVIQKRASGKSWSQIMRLRSLGLGEFSEIVHEVGDNVLYH